MAESLQQAYMPSVCAASTRSQNCGQSLASYPTSTYQSAIMQFKDFFSTFENKLQTVYEKQQYRIYLNDKFHHRIYKQLLSQQDSLYQALNDSKDYKLSANRTLIEQVMNLEKLHQEYQAKNDDYEMRINQKKKQLQDKKKTLKTLQTQIKSYWIYNYDITSTSSLSAYSRVENVKDSIRSSRNQTEANTDSSVCRDAHPRQDKENESREDKKIWGKTSNKSKMDSIHLPSIHQYNRYNTVLRCTSNYENYQYPKKHATTILSKDLSLINSSSTRQKLFKKIECSHKTEAVQKLEYEREKLNLLKFFLIYLKRMNEEEDNFTKRTRMQKVVREIDQCVNEKEQKLKQIQILLSN